MPLDRKALSGAIKTLDESIALEHRKIATMQTLRRLLTIATVDPRIDKHTKASIHIDEGTNLFSPWRGSSLVVTVDGESIAYPLIDVPQSLWPEHILQRYQRSLRHKGGH